MTEEVNESDSIIMVTQRGAIKRISYKVLPSRNVLNAVLLY